MKEKGIDLASQRPRGLDDLPKVWWDHIVTMGCGDACPTLPASHRSDWKLPDPKHLPDDEFRAVRDRIERLVTDLLAETATPREPRRSRGHDGCDRCGRARRSGRAAVAFSTAT